MYIFAYEQNKSISIFEFQLHTQLTHVSYLRLLEIDEYSPKKIKKEERKTNKITHKIIFTNSVSLSVVRVCICICKFESVLSVTLNPHNSKSRNPIFDRKYLNIACYKT